MSTDYTYDEQGQFYPFFVLTVTSLITLPITYSLLKPSKELESTGARVESGFQPEHHDLIQNQKDRQRRRERKFKRGILAIGGWLTMGYMVYLMAVTSRTAPNVWDPYSILGISTSASESQIRKQYKKLSITQHPDKMRPDPAKNLTVETINDKWVEIIKAFKTLTDEEVRNNYIQFGHPDGKQSFSIGIALPQFLVNESYGKYVLLLYGILLGVLLPFLVGKWWYGTQSRTRDGTLVESAANLFREYKEDINEGGVVAATSSGAEFKDRLDSKKDQNFTKVEKAVLSEHPTRVNLRKNDRDLLLSLDDEQRRYVLALMWAYLNRVDLGDATLDEDKYGIAPIALQLSESFTNITLAFGNLQPLLASYRAAQSLIQAVPPGASPLLQLPYFTPNVIKSIEASSPGATKSVQAFMSMTEAKRRRLTAGNGHMTEQQYQTVNKVISQMPDAVVERAFFKVVGERIVTPSSLIQFVVKLRIIPPGTTELPPVNELDLAEPDPKEGDLDALAGRKKKQVKDAATGKTITVEEKPIQPPLAHAPYYSRDHAPRWRVLLADTRNNKIAVPPFTFSTFDKPVFNDDGTPTGNIQTLKMQFQAPPQEGRYAFTMYLFCDSYIGLDCKHDVTMVVDDASKLAEVEEEDDISEPEEDSLAGQLSALKTGEAPLEPRKKKVKQVEEVESSDDSEEEDEDDDSDTDTDTDTDEE